MNPSDTKVQIIGSVSGALIGAIVGSLLTYWASEKARKKQKEADEIKEQRLKIRAHEKSIRSAANEIQELLILILKNIEHYKDLEAGILNDVGDFRTTISLPQPYPHQSGIGNDFMSTSLAIKWQSFEAEVILQNSNLSEFTSYYVALRSSAHEALLLGAGLNRQVINRDHEAVKEGATQNIVASENFKERCFGLLAELELDAAQLKNFDYTTVRLSEIKDYMEKLRNYKPTDKKLLNYIEKEFRKVYIPDKAFRHAGGTI